MWVVREGGRKVGKEMVIRTEGKGRNGVVQRREEREGTIWM